MKLLVSIKEGVNLQEFAITRSKPGLLQWDCPFFENLARRRIWDLRLLFASEQNQKYLFNVMT